MRRDYVACYRYARSVVAMSKYRKGAYLCWPNDTDLVRLSVVNRRLTHTIYGMLSRLIY
jgi:hypothetical protein